jgi:hypothetical protein
VNSASINFIAFSDAGMPSVVVLAGAGVQPDQASEFRSRTQNLSGVLIMYKGGVCMPPQMPGAKHA